MTNREIVIALIIHLFVPLAGLSSYILLVRKINKEKILNAPIIELFAAFATYGGLLLVFLTAVFWKWSGMASLGTFYLVLGAPIVMAAIAYSLRKKKEESKYHNITYNLALLYFPIAPLTLFMAGLFSDN